MFVSRPPSKASNKRISRRRPDRFPRFRAVAGLERFIHARSFSLVELILVVTILGTLAAIAVPRFSQAGEGAKLNALLYNLRVIREQIELYQAEHDGRTPIDNPNWTHTTDHNLFIRRLTKRTNSDGTVNANGGTYGPYLQRMPENPFNNNAAIRLSDETPGNGARGWQYLPSQEHFCANDSPEHAEY